MIKFNTAVLVALAFTGVTCKDLQVGTLIGRVVFDETVQASPAIWRQVQKITVNVSDHEAVSYIAITDNRADKDGDAEIVEGGEGQKNVTIELKSPTVFRGFDFHVVVYAAQDVIQNPVPMSQDVDVNTSAKPENSDNVDTAVLKDTEKEHIPMVPVLTGEQPRLSRNTQEQTIDPVVLYVTEKNLEVDQSSTTEVSTPVTDLSTDGSLKINKPAVPLALVFNEEEEISTTEESKASDVQGFSTSGPQFKKVNIPSSTPKYEYDTSEESDEGSDSSSDEAPGTPEEPVIRYHHQYPVPPGIHIFGR